MSTTLAEYRGARVSLEVVALAAGESHQVAAPANEEAVVVLLQGRVELGGEAATRDSVFASRASAVYLPPGIPAAVDAASAAEIAIATTVGCTQPPATGDIVVVKPGEVAVHRRGRPGWERDVHDVVADNVPAARHLIVGETFNGPGQWSSFPPHKHDGRDGEPALEEVYYYRFDRPEGFGFQGLYEAGGSERAVFLRHGTVVGIPSGYHPVCAAPGYRLYYLWALVGARRQLAMYEDPAHRWLSA